jgi:hypothetical protein
LTYALLAEDPEKEEQPRLWSKGYNVRAPVDEIIAEHALIHALLIRWGLWVRRRSPSTSLASIEGLYSKAPTPPATAPLSADSRLCAVELVVRDIVFLQHRRLLIMLYVFRCSGYTVCRAIKLPFEAYAGETARARGMVRAGVRSILGCNAA